MRRSTLLCALLLLGCGQGPVATNGLSGGDSPGASTTQASATSTDSSGAGPSTSTSISSSTSTLSAGAGSTTEGLRYDMGLPDLPAGTACNKKIDLLFVSSPNHDDIDTIYDSLPAILGVIQEVFADFDLHVMFADWDDKWGAKVCPKGMCPEEGGCLAEGYEDFPCWALYDEDELTLCDNKVGSGITFPAGPRATNKRCPVPEGQRYINGDDPLFAELFECLSHTGLPGNLSDGPGWAMGEALSFQLQTGCNAGFLRDDALLLAVIITPSNSGPYNSYVSAQRVLEAKDSDHDMVVALGIAKGVNAVCGGNDEMSGTVYNWTQYFDHSVFGSICAPSLAPAFAEAATMAAELCDGAPK